MATNNDEIIGAETAISIWSTANISVLVSNNGSITGGHVGVDVTGTTNTGVSVTKNTSITGSFDSGVAISGETNSNISVSRNGAIAGAFFSGDSILVTADVSNGVRVIGNTSVTSGTAGFGIVVEGAVSNRGVVIVGNRLNAGFVGIGVSGANPAGPVNRVFFNRVEASTPDAVFGIALFAAERSHVSDNRVNGFAGELEIEPGVLIGGGIGVISESSNNLIHRNVVDSDPGNDLFWDETGTGNAWAANICDKSSPDGLCRGRRR